MRSSWLALAALAAAGVTGGLAAVLGMAAFAGNLLAAPLALLCGATGYGLWKYADRQVVESVYEPVGGHPAEGADDASAADGAGADGDAGRTSEDWHRTGRVSRGPDEGATADPEDPDSWPWTDPFWHDERAGRNTNPGTGPDGSGPTVGTDGGATDGGVEDGWTRGGSGGSGWPGWDEWTADADGQSRDAGAGDEADDGDGTAGGSGTARDEWDPWWRRMDDDSRGGRAGGDGAGASDGRTDDGRGAPAYAADRLSDEEAFDVLGVEPDADAETVRRAYRERVKEAHPDTPGGSAEEFKRVHRAYDRLRERP